MKIVSHRDEFLRRTEAAFKAAVYDVQLEAMKNAPVDTGDLRRRIHANFLGPLRAVVGTDHPGGKMREFGGTIRAHSKPYLVFFWKRRGRWVKVKQVTQRPGGYSQGFRPWLRPAGRKFGEFLTRHLRAG